VAALLKDLTLYDSVQYLVVSFADVANCQGSELCSEMSVCSEMLLKRNVAVREILGELVAN
jgi:hypothetical protein